MLRPLPSHSVSRERRCGDRMVHDNVASAERGMLLRLLDEEVIEQNVGTGGRVQTVYEQADVSRLERRILSFDNLLTVDVEGQRIAYALASDMDMGRKTSSPITSLRPSPSILWRLSSIILAMLT